MRTSIVICSYSVDRWRDLVDAVESCRAQSMPADQLLVVIDHNPILAARAHEKFDNVDVLENQFDRGLSGARNTGLRAATGDVIAFLDDDAVADVQWLAELVAPMLDSRVAGVGGWVVPRWTDAAPRWFPETFSWVLGCSYAGLPDDGDEIRNPIGASMAFRSSVFDIAGGFSSDLGRVGSNASGCEETELCIRYAKRVPGDRFVLSRRAIVHHRVPASRLTWRYHLQRCWSEGLSKAAVSTLVGTNDGLRSERSYVARALPAEVLASARKILRSPVTECNRLTHVIIGLAATSCGYVQGLARIWLRRKFTQRPSLSENDVGARMTDGAGPLGPA